MKCPKCSAENGEGDKFCVECGAQLVEPVKEERDAPSADKPKEAKAADSAPAADQTPAAEQVSAAAKATAEKAGALADRFKSLPKQKQMIFGGGFAAVVVVIVALVAVMNGGPSNSVVENYLRSQTYSLPQSSATTLTVDSVSVTGKTKMEGPKDLMAFFGASGTTYYSFEAQVKASGNGVEMTATYDSIDVAKAQKTGEWTVYSGSSSSKTYTATAGMDRKAVDDDLAKFNEGTSSTSDIIKKALSWTTEETNGVYPIHLETIYAGGKAEVVDEKFDQSAQTDTFTISLTKDCAFYSASGTITAVYKFNGDGTTGGTWALSSAERDEKTSEVNYDNLIGTWTGSFNDFQFSTFGKCSGASAQPLKVVIESVDNKTLEVKGKFTGLRHQHGKTAEFKQDSTDGDQVLVDQPFTMSFSSDNVLANMTVSYSGYWLSGEKAAEYQSEETSEGQMRLWLAFDSTESGEEDKLQAALITVVNGDKLDYHWGDRYDLSKVG